MVNWRHARRIREELALLVERPVPFENRRTVPLTLVFRNAGQITVDATVTAPFTP